MHIYILDNKKAQMLASKNKDWELKTELVLFTDGRSDLWISPAEMGEPHLNGSESTCTQNSIDNMFGVRSWCLDTLRSGVFFFRR